MLDWKRGECEPIPGKTMPSLVEVQRNYPQTWERFSSVGPLLDTLGNGGKGITWKTEDEVELLGKLNYRKPDGPAKGRPRLASATDAAR